MNGDQKPDLVVTAQVNLAGTYNEQFGAGIIPSWKVYLNNGSGFSSNFLMWSTPLGGNYSNSGAAYGYLAMNGNSYGYANCENWSTTDMDGDQKPDLVITAQFNSAGTYNEQFGAGSTPYWKVYQNNGTGFSSNAQTWSTPVGGNYSNSGTPYGYLVMSGTSFSYANCESYSTVDMDGDQKPDLVVTAQFNTSGQYNQQFGVGGTPYWKIFLNTASQGLEQLSSEGVMVFPNPAGDFATLELKSSLIGERYYLCDLNGAVVLQGLILTNSLKLDLHLLSDGIYFLQLGSSAKPVKLIKG